MSILGRRKGEKRILLAGKRGRIENASSTHLGGRSGGEGGTVGGEQEEDSSIVKGIAESACFENI